MLLCCGTLSCGNVCKHGAIYGRLFKRSPLGCRKGLLGPDRLLTNKKPALCVLNKSASAKTHFKGDIFQSLFLMPLCCMPRVPTALGST